MRVCGLPPFNALHFFLPAVDNYAQTDAHTGACTPQQQRAAAAERRRGTRTGPHAAKNMKVTSSFFCLLFCCLFIYHTVCAARRAGARALAAIFCWFSGMRKRRRQQISSRHMQPAAWAEGATEGRSSPPSIAPCARARRRGKARAYARVSMVSVQQLDVLLFVCCEVNGGRSSWRRRRSQGGEERRWCVQVCHDASCFCFSLLKRQKDKHT
ncbi:hypothetical protein ATANTOWER_031004 [Ataeniobius toweri]|uniref:Uncharacterized protein n=1 Tax=Ataeniobius toweri TaxID=208326 RepID=A0ABU7C363_9TELE|nr:hypothetical protein [Ataeniobius toweri]